MDFYWFVPVSEDLEKPRILTRSIGALCSDNGGGANLAGNVRELGRPGPIFRVVVVASAADPALGYWS